MIAHRAASCLRASDDRLLSLIEAARAEIAAHEPLWLEHRLRQEFPGSAHHDTESIYLRWAPAWTIESIFGTTDAVDCPAAALLPRTVCVARDVLSLLGASEIGRVLLVRLRAGGRIDEHRDEGVYAEHYQRFHVPITSAAGNVFRAGDEEAWMRTGEVWTFDHRGRHSARNDSPSPRIHLIIDAITERPWL